MNTMKTAFAAAGLISSVAGHGYITSPSARMPGTAMASACGQQMYNNQAADNYGNIQGELQQVTQADSGYNATACHVWQCKGYQFADNTANVQTYTAGQVVPIVVDIRAPHTGTANVSIVKTSSDTIIGSVLKSWDVYASTSTTIPDDDKNFSITIPSDLGSECATAGDCVIQWWWNAASIDQTYEACIDFTLGGSGGTTPVSSATPVSSSPAVTSAPVSSAAASVVPTSTVSLVNNVQSTSTVAATSTAATPTSTTVSSTLPKEFTLDTFISWLQEVAGSSSSKAKRAARIHARQVRV